MKIIKNTLLFLLGGGAYVGIELLWRGRSHSSMFLAGGTCFLLLGKLSTQKVRLPYPIRGFIGAGMITMVELLTGLVVNRRYTVWDYRNLPGNFYGQICLPFYFLWVPLSLGAMGLYRLTDQWLSAALLPDASWHRPLLCKSCDRKSKGR